MRPGRQQTSVVPMTGTSGSSGGRSVLMIAYFFPPMAGSAVQRSMKFVKYLPDFGWRPIVVCGDEAHFFDLGLDATLLDDVPPAARIMRPRFVSPLGIRSRLQRLFRVRPTIAGEDPSAADGKQGGAGVSETLRPPSGALRFLGRVLHPLESPPIDAALYWALSIVPLCRRLIAEEQVDLIYTSSDPYSDHIAGWILKRLTGKPWVADFRDPWTQTWNYSHRGWRRRCDLFAEQRVLRYADRVIGVTPSQTQGLWDLVPGRDPAAFVTIENGFDEEDFSSAADRLKPLARAIASYSESAGGAGARTLLSHVGIIYDGTALPFLQALERLGPAGKRLEVRFVGGLAPQERSWLAEHPVSAGVEVLSRVPHTEAVVQMRASDAVLLILGTSARWRGIYTGKLFEYLRCGRPILMVGPEGDASRLVQASGTGCWVPADDIEAVVEALRLLAGQPDAFRARYYHPQQDIIAHYERRALTERLADAFEEVVRSTGSPVGE